MTQLAALRSRLQSLRTARAAVQGGGALAAVLSGVIGLGLGAWGLDLLFRWDRGSRIVILLACLAAVVIMVYRWIGPLLRRRESLEQLALWVERQHRLDGDLVSALQFEQPVARTWGSPRLTSAVIDYVADFSRGLNVFEGFSWDKLPQRLALLGTLLVLSSGLSIAAPAEAAAFWNRFWLGSARYPTRTVIANLDINGRAVDPFPAERTTIAVAQDEPLKITVRVTGEVPETALIAVRGQRSRERGQWPLTAVTDGAFQHTQPSLAESLRLWVRVGDAESDPIDVAVVPLPMVDVRWTVEPPKYARSAGPIEIPAGTRSFAVLAGSRIACTVSCANKSLKSATLRLLASAPSTSSSGERVGARGRALPMTTEDSTETERPAERPSPLTLSLSPEAGAREPEATTSWTSPAHPQLDVVQQPFEYELPVVDGDGLSPKPAIIGEIRLQTDRPPRVSAAAVSRKVLPQAQPRISYGAADDFGVGELRLEWEVIPENGSRRTDRRVLRPRSATESADNVVRGETVFDLRPLNVAPGDEVRLVVAADDDRGDFAPQTGRSEPVIFSVTDQAGILESLLEIDQQSAKQLDAIIEKELGIGGPTR